MGSVATSPCSNDTPRVLGGSRHDEDEVEDVDDYNNNTTPVVRDNTPIPPNRDQQVIIRPTVARVPPPNHRPRPNNEVARPRGKRKIRKNTRAALKVASLNMKGRNARGEGTGISKWTQINQLVRDERIGVLALQETHLTPEHVNQIHQKFERRLKVFSSPDPTEPSRARGVAIVLNKERTNTEGVQEIEIIPGRALLLIIPWHSTLTLHILAIYAPNDIGENRSFWTDIGNTWTEKRLQRPDIILGDFNITEGIIDRIPQTGRGDNAIETLRDLKKKFGLSDGWREMNPTKKEFTYHDHQSQSRIDRIYATKSVIRNAGEWEIKTTHVPTDHKMVTVEVIDRKTPYIGDGRWSIPTHIVRDDLWNDKVQYIGEHLSRGLAIGERDEMRNPQTLYGLFKDLIRVLARVRVKGMTPKELQKIRELEKTLEELLGDENIDTNSTLR